jgi:Rieske 2Fe-2S family protein
VFSELTPQQRREVYYVTIFPTLFLSPHPDFVLTHRIERLSPQRTRIVCDFLFAPESVERAGFDADRAVQFWDLTNRQDWHVCQLTQTGTRSAAYSPGPYSNLESVLAAFDRYYLQQMG